MKVRDGQIGDVHWDESGGVERCGKMWRLILPIDTERETQWHMNKSLKAAGCAH